LGFRPGYRFGHPPEHIRRLFEYLALLVFFKITALEYGKGIIAQQGFEIRSGHHDGYSFNSR
jgi:hypothetical protein